MHKNTKFYSNNKITIRLNLSSYLPNTFSIKKVKLTVRVLAEMLLNPFMILSLCQQLNSVLKTIINRLQINTNPFSIKNDFVWILTQS